MRIFIFLNSCRNSLLKSFLYSTNIGQIMYTLVKMMYRKILRILLYSKLIIRYHEYCRTIVCNNTPDFKISKNTVQIAIPSSKVVFSLLPSNLLVEFHFLQVNTNGPMHMHETYYSESMSCLNLIMKRTLYHF